MAFPLFLILLIAPVAGAGVVQEVQEEESQRGRQAGDKPPRSIASSSSQDSRLSSQERWKIYLEKNFWSPGAAFRSIFPAATRQWGDDPPEWEQGMSGYARRAGSQFAMRSIQGSVEHGLAAMMGIDPRYQPCKCEGFFPRLGYALLSNFVIRTESGTRTVDVPNLAGIYAGSMVAMTWYPDRYNWKDGLREGSQRLITGGSFNIFREFWPEIRRIVPFKRKP